MKYYATKTTTLTTITTTPTDEWNEWFLLLFAIVRRWSWTFGMGKNNKLSPATSENDFVVFINWHQALEKCCSTRFGVFGHRFNFCLKPVSHVNTYNNNSVCMCNYGQSVCANKNHKPNKDVDGEREREKKRPKWIKQLDYHFIMPNYNESPSNANKQ